MQLYSCTGAVQQHQWPWLMAGPKTRCHFHAHGQVKTKPVIEFMLATLPSMPAFDKRVPAESPHGDMFSLGDPDEEDEVLRELEEARQDPLTTGTLHKWEWHSL